MTDTDYDVADDDEMDFSTELDEEIDFDNLYPKDGPYEVEIKSVLWQDYVKDDGSRVRAARVSMQLKDTGDEFEGTYVNKFIYMGNADGFKPIGLGQFKGMCEASGVP